MTVRLREHSAKVALATVAALVVGWAVPASAAPVGPEFQVNTYTTGGQAYSGADVAMDADGNFVVVWDSWGASPGWLGVQGQRYAHDGTSLGTEFNVNAYATGDQWFPSVAMESDGDFVVVWVSSQSSGSDSSGYSIGGRRYASDGSPRGADFQVNTYTTGYQKYPSLAMDADGDFIVVWSSEGSSGSDSSGYSIQGRRYASDGSPRGADFQVNTYTTGSQTGDSLYGEVTAAMDADGDFIVVWVSGNWGSSGSSGTDSDRTSVQGQRYASDGSTVGAEFQVNTYTTGQQGYYGIDVAMDADGDFVVVWGSDGSSGTDSYGNIQGQRYTSDGSTAGAEFQVNTCTTWTQSRTSVAMEATGDFVVVWTSEGSACADNDSYGIQGQRYASNGNPLGTEFHVNTYTTEDQADPSVAAGDGGDFVVVWHSVGSSGNDSEWYSVQGQRFCDDEDDDGTCDGVDACPGFDDNVDVDGDGIADGCDACVSAQTVGEAKLLLKKINADIEPGNDRLKFETEFTVPGGLGALDPVTDGVRILLYSESGEDRIDVSLPGGEYGVAGKIGWKTNRSGSKWKFKDATGSPINGFKALTMRDRDRSVPDGLQVKMKGQRGTYPVIRGDEPVRMTLVVGDGAAGECADTAFTADECAFRESDSLRCRSREEG